MTKPIRILASPLTGRIYAVTKYHDNNGLVVADEKQDVTEDVEALIAERIKHPLPSPQRSDRE